MRSLKNLFKVSSRRVLRFTRGQAPRRGILSLNPEFAIGRGIRRKILAILTFRNTRQANFCMPPFSSGQSGSSSCVSVLASIAKSGLKEGSFSCKIVSEDEVDSTNDVAREYAEKGAPEGTVILAQYQRQGRGRMMRSWSSPKGKNILLSLILRPSLRLEEVSLITVMSSVTVASLLREEGFHAFIKWPNDIYVEGKKVAGILTEMKSEKNEVKHVIVGIGLNVNMDSSECPEDIQKTVTSLAMLSGHLWDRTVLVRELLLQLEKTYEHLQNQEYDFLLSQWSRLSSLVGHWVEVKVSDKKWEGTVLGTDAKGALLLRREGGFIEAFLSGDVKILDRMSV